MSTLLLIDDDEVERAGRDAILRGAGLRVVAGSWSDLASLAERVDRAGPPVTALVVVRRDPSAWDRFHVLRTAPHLRDVVGSGRCVAAMGERWIAEPLVRSRLAAAGADEVVPLERLRTGRAVGDVATGELRGGPAAPAQEELALRLVGRRSNPARVVERILELAADDPAYLRAFDPWRQQNECGLSRRRAHTLRVKVAEIGDLRPSHGVQTGGPLVDRSLPRWTEMVQFVNRCRGFGPDDDVGDEAATIAS